MLEQETVLESSNSEDSPSKGVEKVDKIAVKEEHISAVLAIKHAIDYSPIGKVTAWYVQERGTTGSFTKSEISSAMKKYFQKERRGRDYFVLRKDVDYPIYQQHEPETPPDSFPVEKRRVILTNAQGFSEAIERAEDEHDKLLEERTAVLEK